MGKRIIQQARGKGSLTYRVRRKAYRFRVSYPSLSGCGKIIKLINSPAHSTPLAKIKIGNEIFYNVAVNGVYEGQIIEIGENATIKEGNIIPLEKLPIGTEICNIETIVGNGGKLVRSSGTSAKIVKRTSAGVIVLLPSKKEKLFSFKARATVGVVAGSNRVEKPILKAGKKYHIMKARNKFWPRTSAVKVNVVDHPFGSGRGKRIKSKIAKKGAPPGRKVGLLRPRRAGRRKR